MDGWATSLVCWPCRYLECGPVYWIAFFTQFIVVAVDPESVKVREIRKKLGGVERG